MMRQKLHLS